MEEWKWEVSTQVTKTLLITKFLLILKRLDKYIARRNLLWVWEREVAPGEVAFSQFLTTRFQKTN